MMKKISILFIVMLLTLLSNASFTLAKAEISKEVEDLGIEEFPTVHEIDKANEALDELVVQANENLANGIESFYLRKSVENGFIELTFTSYEVTPFLTNPYNAANTKFLASTTAAASAVKKKVYSAYVKNTIGWNFQHVLAGEFTYSNGKIMGATKDARLTGLVYSESHNTWIDVLDPSVWYVHSHGNFKAFKYLVEYNTYLSVQLLGSGNYRITRAEISA
ncbi:hypothetical protein [Lysinibacillus sp. FSL K6-3209]|uniref:hypothetical protein n=1 Tax=Lysinibacillus sp. FSL K6-3209 TaxID=2921497 RepID=UPI0030DAF362